MSTRSSIRWITRTQHSDGTIAHGVHRAPLPLVSLTSQLTLPNQRNSNQLASSHQNPAQPPHPSTRPKTAAPALPKKRKDTHPRAAKHSHSTPPSAPLYPSTSASNPTPTPTTHPQISRQPRNHPRNTPPLPQSHLRNPRLLPISTRTHPSPSAFPPPYPPAPTPASSEPPLPFPNPSTTPIPPASPNGCAVRPAR